MGGRGVNPPSTFATFEVAWGSTATFWSVSMRSLNLRDIIVLPTADQVTIRPDLVSHHQVTVSPTLSTWTHHTD